MAITLLHIETDIDKMPVDQLRYLYRAAKAREDDMEKWICSKRFDEGELFNTPKATVSKQAASAVKGAPESQSSLVDAIAARQSEILALHKANTSLQQLNAERKKLIAKCKAECVQLKKDVAFLEKENAKLKSRQ